MADLIERLREVDRYAPHDGLPSILDLVAKDCAEAAHEIESLRNRTDDLEIELAGIKQYRPTLARVAELEAKLKVAEEAILFAGTCVGHPDNIAALSFALAKIKESS